MALFPLESNPEVMTKFLHKLGVSEEWHLADVLSFEDDCLDWIPRPAAAFILLFPCSDKFYEHAAQQKKELQDQIIVPDLYYMKQYVSNACGTIALIHSVANNVERIPLQDGIFKKILDDSKDLDPEERGKLLQDLPNNPYVMDMINAHQELALEGQTELNPDEKVNHHFVAFVEKGGYLYELDGRKEFPVNHGKTTRQTFVNDAAKVCKDFIARDHEDVNFTAMVLTSSVE
ncbi:ubiquitin carboxyl-terminal hydrolase [Coccinella septempunctata]|uniref:ubiquitin carboxyl-terminal hydrolase n=1 Tax=Coccinella septempunctata TaxID=41139 RepID=UPI001D073BB0|nr:ubiquitin carboxyl-terminal hydrolase [Coccinella septempunctata]